MATKVCVWVYFRGSTAGEPFAISSIYHPLMRDDKPGGAERYVLDRITASLATKSPLEFDGVIVNTEEVRYARIGNVVRD